SPGVNANLDFRTGTLAGWEGDGFYVTSATGRGPCLSMGVCSSDRGTPGRTGTLHRMVTVPPGAGVLRCTAHVVRGTNHAANPDLNIVVFAAGKKILPRLAQAEREWQESKEIQPAVKGKPREYVWRVSHLVGQNLRIVLIDDDKRPGCHLSCSGFRFQSAD